MSVRVYATYADREFDLLQIDPAEMRAIFERSDKHLIGIPVYWSRLDDDFQVWPQPAEGIKVKTDEIGRSGKGIQ